jgi:hypothetical protein
MRRNLLSIALAGLLTLCATHVGATTFEEDLHDLTDEQIDDTVEFSLGNTMFFLLHEAGHMLVSEFDLPVLGREEDAVDTLSTLLLLAAEKDTFNTALIDSVDGWTFSAEASEEAEEEQELWGAHALDRQRAFNMVCLMVGKDAKTFKESADNLEMPKSRREECVGEYQKARDSWFGLLKAHMQSGTKKTKFVINYQNPKSDDLKGYADAAKQAQVLDNLGMLMANLYALKEGIKLTATECGEPNAYWSAKNREVTYCYELLQWHTQTVANYFRNGEDSSDDEDEAEEKTSEAKPASTRVFGTATARQ